MNRRVTLDVPDAAAGGRVDRFVADASGLSRSYVQRLIGQGRLTADGRVVAASSRLGGGSRLRLDVPAAAPVADVPESIPLRIVYRDAAMLIIDKPAGLVTHPAPGHPSGTLVNGLLGSGESLSATVAGRQRPGIVHRLDRDTSGLLMIARHDAAQARLQALLRARRVRKDYLCLVIGSVAAQLGRIEAPIGRDARHRTRMAVVAAGRPSVTGYRVRERFAGWTLLEVELLTGRTHQIRVHLASIGHPAAGDRVYGSGDARTGPAGLGRLFLHAWRLALPNEAGDGLIRAESPLPPELERVLDGLREDGLGGLDDVPLW
ncbi:MAG: RluA family pseudouridine synthase [Candidatus Limnocylindrales bacterium]